MEGRNDEVMKMGVHLRAHRSDVLQVSGGETACPQMLS